MGEAPKVPELSGGAHFPCLDAYRGIGMLMVLLSHASFATGHTGSALGPYLSRFELAVPMFFMLSGFLLYRAYARTALADRAPMEPATFLRRRSLRIFPGYWAALLGIAILFGRGVLDTVWIWVCNLLLLQQFGVDEPLRITQAWSIGVELSFYLLLPLFAALTTRLSAGLDLRARTRVLVGGCGLLVLTGWVFRIAVVTTSPPPDDPAFLTSWQAHSLNWLPMYLDFFAIGMLLAVVSAWHASGHPLPRLAGRAGEHPAACWLVAFGIFLLVAQMDPPPVPFGLNGTEYLPRQAAYSIGSAIWLAPAIFGDQQRGRLRQVLASRPLTWLGAISLSFYLWHLDVIHQAQSWTVEGYDDLTGLATFAGDFWVVSALAIGVTIVIAGLVHRFVEVPFLLMKDRPARVRN